MPKHKKKQVDAVVPAEVIPNSTKRRKILRPGIIIGAVVGIVVLIVAFSVYYQTQAAPFQQPVLTVDKSILRMDYFLKRAKIAGSNQANLLQQLVDEQIVKEMAPTFGITVTQPQIDNYLLYTASTANTTPGDNFTGTYLTESEYKAWYSQQLKNSGLTDAQFQDMARTSLLERSLQAYFAQRIPSIAEQVHLNVIVLGSSADATKAKARIQSGENFTAVARDMSLDTQTKDKGGDFGWIPRGVLPYDDTVFALNTGVVSDPVAVNSSSPATSQYLLFMVSEKSAGRDIDANSLQVLQQKALTNWLAQEEPSHSITVNYDFNNAANQAWITWQLSRSSR